MKTRLPWMAFYAQAKGNVYIDPGAADLMYLAVRLAIVELTLPSEEPCPIVLDLSLIHIYGRVLLGVDLVTGEELMAAACGEAQALSLIHI